LSKFRLGPFEAQQWIAAGGMGDVWRGVHVSQDIPVAIKVLRRNTSEALPFMKVFRREVRAVAQLDHPGIITLFDIGDVSEETAEASSGELEVGNPYLVMEYVAGGSLEAFDDPLPWKDTKEILMAVLDCLAHAHARGITHRDLKPANVLLSEGSSPSRIRLTDFGIAFSFSENRSDESDGKAVGTPTYMSPEQFMGDWRAFGPWTDLYSLGCVAYELASGRVPFEETQIVALGMAHLRNTPPDLEPPSDYPDGFESWVLKLLEKDPMSRYTRCADAALELEALGDPATDSEFAVSDSGATYAIRGASLALPLTRDGDSDNLDWRAPDAPRPPFEFVGAGLRLFELKDVPMVDRVSERDLLWDTFVRVKKGGGLRAVVLEGAAGTGKSRLGEWLSERTHEMGLAHSLKAEHDRPRGGEANLSRMLADAWFCVGADGDALASRVETVLARTDLKSRAARKAVTELLAPASLGENYSPGTFFEFGSRTERFGIIVDVLRSVFRDRTVVLWLDDVHWGADALHFLTYLAERSREETLDVLAVLTVRDDLLVESPEASELLSRLCKEDFVQCVHVEALSERDTRALVSKLLYLEGDLADRVSSWSEGNPLYATQLVGDWVNRGILEPGSGGFVLSGTSRPEIPNDVHAFWVRRMGRVLEESIDSLARYPSPSEQRMQMQLALELGAALGKGVDMSEWMEVCSLVDVPQPTQLLDSLLASRLARLRDNGWSFSHSMLRDSIERIARESRRWTSHNRLCAKMLAARRPVPHWGDSERIGRFRYEAEEFDEALDPLFRGARERKRVEEYASALELMALRDRAIDRLDVPNEDRRRTDGMLFRADIYCTRGQLDLAAELANQALLSSRSAASDRHEGAALQLLARVERQRGDNPKALEMFTDAVKALRGSGPRHQLADCLSEQANALLDGGRLTEAHEAFSEAQELFEDTGRLLQWAENQLGLARVALLQGEMEQARTLCGRVRSFARREELSRVEAAACFVTAELLSLEGEREQAIDSLDSGIALSERIGMIRQTVLPRLQKASLLVQIEDHDRARTELEQIEMRPALEITEGSRLLKYCVQLALEIDGSAKGFAEGVRETGKLAKRLGNVSSDAISCLSSAASRARERGYPERAKEVEKLVSKLKK